jgi:hypothetical protein
VRRGRRSLSQKTGGVINDTQFDVAEDGHFEIRLGGEPSDRNWLAVPPDACRITTRHYYEDDVPAPRRPRHTDFEIEVLDPDSPPAPPGDANVAEAIRRVATFMRTAMLDPGPPPRENQPDFVSRVPNEFPKPVKPGDFGLAAADAAYSMAPFVVPPGHALVVDGRWPDDCRSANVCLWNRHMQTFDYLNRQVTLNRRQTQTDAEGRFRIVIAHEDPGVPNWLDTQGRRTGLVNLRHFWGEVLPTPTATVVEADDVRAALPAGTPVVTPEQRAATVRDRREHLAWRFRT